MFCLMDLLMDLIALLSSISSHFKLENLHVELSPLDCPTCMFAKLVTSEVFVQTVLEDGFFFFFLGGGVEL